MQMRQFLHQERLTFIAYLGSAMNFYFEIGWEIKPHTKVPVGRQVGNLLENIANRSHIPSITLSICLDDRSKSLILICFFNFELTSTQYLNQEYLFIIKNCLKLFQGGFDKQWRCQMPNTFEIVSVKA